MALANQFAFSVDAYHNSPTAHIKLAIMRDIAGLLTKLSVETANNPYSPRPSGRFGGFFGGIGLDMCASTPNKLVFYFTYEHTDWDAFCRGQDGHQVLSVEVIVTPSLVNNFDVTVQAARALDILAHEDGVPSVAQAPKGAFNDDLRAFFVRVFDEALSQED